MATEQPIQFQDGWDYIMNELIVPLKDMLDEGLENKKTRLFSDSKFMDGYTKCYQMCSQRTPHNWAPDLYRRHGETIEEYLKQSVVPALEQTHGETLLNEMNRRWSNHKVLNKWFYKFFQYLDRFYVPYQKVPELATAGLTKFKKVVFDATKKNLTEAIVDFINQERCAQVVDHDLIRSCVTLYEAMGMKTLETYITDFEGRMLEATREYYQRKTADWMQSDPTPAFLIKVEKALNDERQRVEAYLNMESLPKMMRVLEEEGLEKCQKELLEKPGSGCRVLLANDKLDDLARMYRLFARLKGGLEPMAAIVQEHISQLGNDEMDARMRRIAEGEKETDNDPIFIKAILAIHEKYKKVVNTTFAGEACFQKALFNAFKDIVNRDEGKHKNAELVSTFCDRILKTGGEKLSESEVEDYLDKVVQIFNYLTDKDLFGEIYKTQLAKRLLNSRSSSNDMERQMIGKLKKEATPQFTSKMEGMMNDLSIGEDSAGRFNSYYKDQQQKVELADDIGRLDFSVQILTQGHWPTYKAFEPNIPATMSSAMNVFTSFYASSEDTSHRRLAWQWTLGSATVKATYARKSYDFQVSSLQGILLGLFSGTTDPISMATLVEKMAIPEDAIKRVIHGLVFHPKQKVLIRVPGPSADATTPKGAILSDDSFRVDVNFSSPMKRIRIPMASLEESHNPKRVEEDRSIAIEAAAVRIMKARKTLTHQQLIAEVLTQLAFFKPSPRDIKARLESLIERDYLERDSANSNTYKYLA